MGIALMDLTFLSTCSGQYALQTGSYCLLESQTQQYIDMEHVDYLHPLGLQHFYDGFSLRAEVSKRMLALEAFQLQEEDISPDLVLSLAAVAARGWGGHHEQPVDHNAPFLQPLFQAKPRPIANYPFEAQEEHFQRFQNTSDSLAARIPWLTPHQQHGGPLANEIITSLSPSFFGDPERPSVFLFSPPPSGFYIIISPFENNILHFLPDPLPFCRFIPSQFMSSLFTLRTLSFLTFPPANPFIFHIFYSHHPNSPRLVGLQFSLFPHVKSFSLSNLPNISLSYLNTSPNSLMINRSP